MNPMIEIDNIINCVSKIVGTIKWSNNIAYIILYGSRVRGFTHEHSDVDLLIRIDGDVDILDFVLSFISELAIFLNWLWRSK